MNIIIPIWEGAYGVHDDPSWALDYILTLFRSMDFSMKLHTIKSDSK